MTRPQMVQQVLELLCGAGLDVNHRRGVYLQVVGHERVSQMTEAELRRLLARAGEIARERREHGASPPPLQAKENPLMTDPANGARAEFSREAAALQALGRFQCAADGSVPDGYRADAKGRLVPDRMVGDAARLEDATVRTIAAYALDLHRQVHRFVGHCYDDLAAMDDLLAEKYGLRRRGGARGNRTYASYDGTLRVVVQVQDRIQFGSELQIARDLVQECIAEWGEGARDEIRVLAGHAFDTDKGGNVSREKVFALRRLDIDDDRWRVAQAAITDAIRVVGSKTYIRFYARPSPEDGWTGITIDTAARPLPETLA